MKRKHFLPAILLLAVACGRTDRVQVRTDMGTTRVEAVAPGVFHVTSVPRGAAFSKEASLCVVPQKGVSDCSMTQDERYASLICGGVTARVDKASGLVTFLRDGVVLTGENARSFQPFTSDGVSAWTVQQVFDSSDDESFFGLGQHQADEWDYKGRNEELYQYNTKISVPFVVSSKHYGILWDSYSFCRWGDPRPYASLGDVFTLYDKDGIEGALTGTYTPAQGEPLVRRETSLEQEFLRTPQCDVVRNAPEGFNFNGSKVLFEGSLAPRTTGRHDFYLYYAGYTRVLVDGKEIVPEIWRTAWNPNGRKFSLDMKAGVKADIRVEWIPDGGVSYDAIRVLGPRPESIRGQMSWWGEMQDQIDYYFVAGDDIDGVIGGYRTLTGKSPIIPKWALGYWQSRERYVTQDEILSTLKEFRDREIPVDNIVQDWQYWKPDQWGSHEFDESRFPDPKAMVDSIHALNARYMISVWPKFYVGTEHFKELDSKGWIYRVAVDSNVVDWLGYEQSFYDAYAPGARKLFWQQMEDHLVPLGVDAWWMDASEPNIHDCTDMDFRKAMCGPTALGPSAKYFNAYALMNAQAIYEGQRAADPDRRVFLLTRNGFAGLQRYSTASWSGDIGTRWEDMKAQISAGLNYSISGIPYWGQDIGGFSVENRYVAAQQLFDRTGKVNEDLKEWRELQARWHEWGVFCPLYRAHGQWPCREPWNIAPKGTQTYDIIVNTDKLRYRLMPYLYSLAAKVHFDDYTLMRPLVMDFTDDIRARGISDQFMLGPAIMVCPVYEYGARSRQVYLPEGQWYDWNSGEAVQGGCSFVADAPIDRIPVYVRGGSILVTGNPVQSSAEAQDKLMIRIAPGADADFVLYEDDGMTYAYERGEYCKTTLHWDDAAGTLSVSDRTGSFEPGDRSLLVTVYGSDAKPQFVKYDGKEIVINCK
ncbi:MAG: DUF5110 domain-containing protein [Bacteroidales bacterium]|nr:DUF5110 domain-containing protein [Candidatus Hennigimonas equi]